MPYIKVNKEKLYYEVHGTGTPLIMLNGIMMSHVSWHPFLEALKDYQIILFDFYDQGLSSKQNEHYDHQIQVEAVRHLVTELDLKDISLFGISYGAQIALQYAINYPVKKLIIFNAALYTTPWLNDIGQGWSKAAQTYDAELFFHVSIPYIYSHVFYNKHFEWISERKPVLLKVFDHAFLDAMNRLIESSENYDIRNEVNKITCSTLVVGSEYDYLTPCNETRAIADAISQAEFEIFYNCGHASMYEKTDSFIQSLKGFLQ